MSDIRTPSSMRFIFFSVLFASNSFTMLACGETGERPSIQTIEGHEWRISAPAEDVSQTWPHRGLTRRSAPYIALMGETLTGSTGCGRLTGTFHGIGDRIRIDAKWIDDPSHLCDMEDQRDAAQIVAALSCVRRIVPKPNYWHEDAFLLSNNAQKIIITLSPKQPGSDLSDQIDTFWHLTRLKGEEITNAVVRIEESTITISTTSLLYSYPYEYELRGLKFSPAWHIEIGKTSDQLTTDKKIARNFHKQLGQIHSYLLSDEQMTFFDAKQKAIIGLTRMRSSGLVARRWTILRYRSAVQGKQGQGELIDTKDFADITLLNGRVDGSPGCGGWVGQYKLDSEKLTVSADSFLAGRCSSQETIEAAAIVKCFKNELQVEVHDNSAVLRDRSGLIVVELAEY